MKTKKFQWLLLLATAMVFAIATGCNKDNKEKEVEEPENLQLQGEISGKRELKSGNEYKLEGSLIVKEGGELIIPAGTTIKAKEGYSSYILVLRGGTIQINGTAEQPVKMVSEDANAGRGYWGGLIINGNAPLTSGQKEFATEINAQYMYGGDNPSDNSGSITYLIIDGAGAQSNDNIEHNGLTLNGVGSGTKIENVYVHNSADDGIEFFGGSVNVTNLLVVNSDDDMFDFTQGYNGTLKNCYGIWEQGFDSKEKDPRGVEADGNHDGEHSDDTNQSNFTIENMTIDLRCTFVMQDAIKIRRGATATIKNALIKGGQAENIIDLSDKKGDAVQENITYTVKDTKVTEETKFGGVAEDKRTITKDENQTGCAQSVFSWTGYKF